MDQLVYTFEPKNGAFQAPLGVSTKGPIFEHSFKGEVDLLRSAKTRSSISRGTLVSQASAITDIRYRIVEAKVSRYGPFATSAHG